MSKLRIIGYGCLGFMLIFCYVFNTTKNHAAAQVAPLLSNGFATSVLYEITNECGPMTKTSDDIYNPTTQWGRCERDQGILKGAFGCSGTMFYEGTDKKDPTAKTGQWYVNQAKLAGCLVKVKSQIDILKSSLCENIVHGDGVQDGEAWPKCNEIQANLRVALECSKDMLKKKDNRYYTQNDSLVEQCENNLNDLLSTKTKGANGENKQTLGEIIKSGKYESGSSSDSGSSSRADAQADCDAKLDSMLSWILCPVIDLGVNMSDYVFENFISPFMENVPISTDPRDGTYKAWQQFRIIANVLLIGTMLAIVYAQIKGDR